MIRFTLRHLLKNYILMAWPVLIVIFVVATPFLGEVKSTGVNTFDIIYNNGFRLKSVQLGAQIMSVLGLILMIGLPYHLAENLQPDRISLLLSKPISRTDFFLGDITAVGIISFFYSLISTITFAIYLGLSAGIFPTAFLLAMFCYTLFAMMYYAAISLILVLSGSYMLAVMTVFILSPLSIFLIISDQILPDLFGINSGLILTTAEVLKYFIPGSGAVTMIYSALLKSGNNIASTFPFDMLPVLVVSSLPFFGLSYFLFKRKEF